MKRILDKIKSVLSYSNVTRDIASTLVGVLIAIIAVLSQALVDGAVSGKAIAVAIAIAVLGGLTDILRNIQSKIDDMPDVINHVDPTGGDAPEDL